MGDTRERIEIDLFGSDAVERGTMYVVVDLENRFYNFGDVRDIADRMVANGSNRDDLFVFAVPGTGEQMIDATSLLIHEHEVDDG